ncbi:MAG: calcineurin-like phosphoesterase family protein [Fuerstiella sp.]
MIYASTLRSISAFVVLTLASALQSAHANETATGIVFADANDNGVQDSGEQGLAGIGVSNGREVVQTDQDGRYKIAVDNDTIVFVIKPTGYRTELDEDHLSRFYYIHKPAGSKQGLKFPGVEPTGPLPAAINFPLVPQEEPTEFDVLFFGDPQPRNQQEIDYIAHDVVEPLIGSDAAFGVTLGDILFDDLSLFDSFNHTVGRIGIPWYNVIGNHDINYAAARDEDSDETFERVYGPAYYSFNYGGVHFINVDDVHWMSDGDRMLYRSGLSEKQLDFIQNDLALVPQDTLVVAMMHIPLVKSTPWLQPKRERLFRLLESRDHCVSLAGHTHHHEHVMLGSDDGWKNPKPHHHIINVTVSGSWWSGQPDENEIPHTMCKDGTPNGYTIMHFDGAEYLLEYRAARKAPGYQIRIMAEEELCPGDADRARFFANVFNAMPEANVEWKFVEDEKWQPMQKESQADPAFQKLWQAEQKDKAEGKLAWRELPSPMKSPHLWSAQIPTDLPVGTYGIQVRCTNPNGQILTGHRIFRVTEVAATK